MLGDELDAAIIELQAQAESAMTTPCTISRGGTVTAGLYGEDVVVAGEVVYTGGCRIRRRDLQPQSAQSADSTVIVQAYEIHVPVTAGPFLRGDLVDAPGVVLRVVVVPILATRQTAQRLPVEVLSS